MAPQTNIGSSTPIDVGGGNIQSDLRRKVINDAAASLRELARTHGRNVQWADSAVRKASNLGASEALKEHVIDVIAPTLPALLDKIDGRKTKPKGLVLHTAGAQITTVDMSLWQKILNTLIDPNLIVLFMSIGTLGIVVELWNPGLIFPGTLGAICLVLGLFGLQVLPISAAGVLLMLLAFAFFAAEAFVPTHGAITLAGGVCFVLGSLLLFEPAGEHLQGLAARGARDRRLTRPGDGRRLVQARPGPPGAGRHGHERALRPGRRRPRGTRSRRFRLRPGRALASPDERRSAAAWSDRAGQGDRRRARARGRAHAAVA